MPAEPDDHARMPYQLPFPPDALTEIVVPDAVPEVTSETIRVNRAWLDAA